MAISQKLKQFLDRAKVDYQMMEHEPAYTALETAQAQHVPGRQMVKSVVVEADGAPLLCVLSAVQKIDFSKLKNILKSKEVHLLQEKAVAALFPDYEKGAEPPFAPEGMRLYMDKKLEENDAVLFNGGTHLDLVKMKFKDYVALARPLLADFGEHL